MAGTVATPQMKTHAAELASRVPGIKTLYDDVELAPPRAAWDATKDAWITARIRSELMLDLDIRSANYTIDNSERVGVPDRFGAHTGGASARHPHCAVHSRRQAGRLLCRAAPRCSGRGTADALGRAHWVERPLASGILTVNVDQCRCRCRSDGIVLDQI